MKCAIDLASNNSLRFPIERVPNPLSRKIFKFFETASNAVSVHRGCSLDSHANRCDYLRDSPVQILEILGDGAEVAPVNLVEKSAGD